MNTPEIARHWLRYQPLLFSELEVELDPPTDKHKEVIFTLDVLKLERLLGDGPKASTGRPPVSRLALARAFVAKAVLNLPTTRSAIDRLLVDPVLRRICGFGSRREIPSEATFSNAFAEFAEEKLASRVHENIIFKAFDGRIVGHVSRDSTSIEGRERPKKKIAPEPSVLKKRGRPKKGEERPPEPKRIEQQMFQSLEQMVSELPTACDVGAKKNAKGFTETWIGYKLHIDADDNGVPLSCILTSASLHDSQVAIPLETMTTARCVSLYSLMDKAYDAEAIRFFIDGLGKVAIIDRKAPRGGEAVPLSPAEAQRYKIRTTIERTNSELKDNHGGRNVRVRGSLKVMTHLMFGMLAITAAGLLRHFV